MITGNVPGHLVLGARAGFLNAIKTVNNDLWKRVAMQINLDGRATDLVDLGATPMPTESKFGGIAQDFVERTATIKPKDWEIVVWVSYDALKDDRTNDLDRRVRDAAVNFNKHMNKLVFQALNAGDTNSYGLCFDAQTLYSNTHSYPGASYQTAQDNLNALDLTLPNFDTVWTSLATFNDDSGEPLSYTPNLLIVPPALRRAAAQVCEDKEDPTTANRAINPFSGEISYITTPYFDTTAWVLLCASESIKPIMLGMREQPSLQASWFDPQAPDGGRYYFKFFSRYSVVYGHPLLVAMGHS